MIDTQAGRFESVRVKEGGGVSFRQLGSELAQAQSEGAYPKDSPASNRTIASYHQEPGKKVPTEYTFWFADRHGVSARWLATGEGPRLQQHASLESRPLGTDVYLASLLSEQVPFWPALRPHVKWHFLRILSRWWMSFPEPVPVTDEALAARARQLLWAMVVPASRLGLAERLLNSPNSFEADRFWSQMLNGLDALISAEGQGAVPPADAFAVPRDEEDRVPAEVAGLRDVRRRIPGWGPDRARRYLQELLATAQEVEKVIGEEDGILLEGLGLGTGPEPGPAADWVEELVPGSE